MHTHTIHINCCYRLLNRLILCAVHVKTVQSWHCRAGLLADINVVGLLCCFTSTVNRNKEVNVLNSVVISWHVYTWKTSVGLSALRNIQHRHKEVTVTVLIWCNFYRGGHFVRIQLNLNQYQMIRRPGESFPLHVSALVCHQQGISSWY